MMLKGCILNTKEDLSGDKFSLECLKKLANATTRIPFTICFEHRIGDAFNFRVDESTEELLCDFDAQDNLDTVGLVPVIGYLYDHNDVYNGVDDKCRKMTLCEVSLTDKPASIGTWIREE